MYLRNHGPHIYKRNRSTTEPGFPFKGVFIFLGKGIVRYRDDTGTHHSSVFQPEMTYSNITLRADHWEDPVLGWPSTEVYGCHVNLLVCCSPAQLLQPLVSSVGYAML